MPGCSQGFGDLAVSIPSLSQTSFQLWESWLQSWDQESTQTIIKTRLLSLPNAQFRNPGVATELSPKEFVLGAASHLTHQQMASQAAKYHLLERTSQNFRFDCVFKRKILKHEFLKSNHFGPTQREKKKSPDTSKLHLFNTAE